MRRKLTLDEQAALARAKFNRLAAGGSDRIEYRYLLPSEIRTQVTRDPRHRTLR